MSSRCMVSNININHSNLLDKCELATAGTILLLDPFIAAPLCLAVYLHSSYICTTAPDAKYGYLCQMSVYMCANIIWHDTLACILTFSLLMLFSIEDYYSSSILIAIFHLYKYNTHSHIERIYEDTMNSWQLSPLGIGTLVRKDIFNDVCKSYIHWWKFAGKSMWSVKVIVFSSQCQNWGTLMNRSCCSLNKNLIKTKSRSENTRS